LSDRITEEALYDMFGKFGRVLTVRLMTDAVGRPKGYAFVSMETTEAAQTAQRASHKFGE